MAKKDFTGGFQGLLNNLKPTDENSGKPTEKSVTPQPQQEEQPTPRRGRPRKPETADEVRATFIIRRDLLDDLKAEACRQTGELGRKVTIKELLAEALTDYLHRS